MQISRLAVTTALCFSVLGAVELSDSERAAVTAVGQEASQVLMKSLKTALTSAMQEGGPAHAVDFCSEKALDLTAEAQQKLNGLDLKRTSHRYRNPANAPDARESEVLKQFEEAGPSERPKQVVEKFTRDGKTFYRYYEPIQTATFCLTCHGEQIPQQVRTTLAERYPDDRATGYQEGDFRGVIRVEIPAERLTE